MKLLVVTWGHVILNLLHDDALANILGAGGGIDDAVNLVMDVAVNQVIIDAVINLVIDDSVNLVMGVAFNEVIDDAFNLFFMMYLIIDNVINLPSNCWRNQHFPSQLSFQ